jgi:hypothetical protein
MSYCGLQRSEYVKQLLEGTCMHSRGGQNVLTILKFILHQEYYRSFSKTSLFLSTLCTYKRTVEDICRRAIIGVARH